MISTDKVYIELSKEELHTCFLCINFLEFSMALGFRQRYSRGMQDIFHDLSNKHYIYIGLVKYLKGFLNYIRDIYNIAEKYGKRDCSKLELKMIEGIIDKIHKEVNKWK